MNNVLPKIKISERGTGGSFPSRFAFLKQKQIFRNFEIRENTALGLIGLILNGKQPLGRFRLLPPTTSQGSKQGSSILKILWVLLRFVFDFILRFSLPLFTFN